MARLEESCMASADMVSKLWPMGLLFLESKVLTLIEMKCQDLFSLKNKS